MHTNAFSARTPGELTAFPQTPSWVNWREKERAGRGWGREGSQGTGEGMTVVPVVKSTKICLVNSHNHARPSHRTVTKVTCTCTCVSQSEHLSKLQVTQRSSLKSIQASQVSKWWLKSGLESEPLTPSPHPCTQVYTGKSYTYMNTFVPICNGLKINNTDHNKANIHW